MEIIIEVLWVEDSAEERLLIQQALGETKQEHMFNLHFVYDWIQAMEFLRKEGAFMRTPNPDIIILDINMPRKNGQEVLAEIKRSEKLKLIPVIMLSSSSAEENTRTSYLNNANCYITKPFTYEKFVEAIKPIESFWLKNVSLPAA